MTLKIRRKMGKRRAPSVKASRKLLRIPVSKRLSDSLSASRRKWHAAKGNS